MKKPKGVYCFFCRRKATRINDYCHGCKKIICLDCFGDVAGPHWFGLHPGAKKPKRVVLGVGYPSFCGDNKKCCYIGISDKNKLFNKPVGLMKHHALEIPWGKNKVRDIDAPCYKKIRLVAEVLE